MCIQRKSLSGGLYSLRAASECAGKDMPDDIDTNSTLQRLLKNIRFQSLRILYRKGSQQTGIFAVASAKTRLVTLAHQDDLYEPSYTEKIIQAANICQDPIILFSDYWELRGDQKSQSSSVIER